MLTSKYTTSALLRSHFRALAALLLGCWSLLYSGLLRLRWERLGHLLLGNGLLRHLALLLLNSLHAQGRALLPKSPI